MSKVLVRATNWLGDAVMSLPAIRTIRQVFPHAHLAVLARPSVAGLYARETCIDRVIPYPAPKGLGARRELAARLRAERFDGAILLQNAFDAALTVWLGGIPAALATPPDGGGPPPRVGRPPARGALRWCDPAAERLRRRADGVAGRHPGAHRIPPRRARHAPDARPRRARTRRHPAP